MIPKLMLKSIGKKLTLLSIFVCLCYISFGQNPIVTENLLPGNPESEWFVNEGGPIEGFAQEFSVNKGQTVHFKINIASATPVPYTVRIYRIGYYQGNGARFIADLGNSLTGGSQPAYNYETSTGKADCSNWAVSASWTVPNNSSTVSGVYAAKFECPAVGGASIQLFVVRDDNSNSPVLFKTSDATWQAYNTWGGNTFYAAATPVPGFTHATKVSYQRPVYIRGDKSSFFNSEYPMIRWLEKNGYSMSYATDMDMARDASVYTPSIHKVLLSVGHDEYWSLEQRTKFENARTNGVNVAFFSGNEMYWKTRWEDNYQTLVCYKEGTMGELICGSKCDPMPNVWTGLWRDGCSSAYGSNDGCKPEGSFTGQMSWTLSLGSIKVPDTYKNLRFWKNTSIASLGAGQTVTLPFGTLGQEWDPEQFTDKYPPHRIVLSNTLQGGLTHKMSLYRYSSGALIFSAGTMNWSWGLDDHHDSGNNSPASSDMQQATVNLLHDMGVGAGSIQSNLVTPTIGTDVLAPTTTISSPLHGATIGGGSIIISGTSSDNGGGTIAGVEVSTDNGLTWNIATGTGNWTYTFSPTGYGSVTIKVRAWDDLGNVEVVGAPGSPNCIVITAAGPFDYSVFNANYPQTPPTFFTGNPVELGMKFKSSIPGYITGFRYYKGSGVTGAHTGHLWDNNGNLLASQAFTNETPMGWQSVTLTTPVAITANTTYVVSYFTASGDFTKEDGFFTQAITNGFLRGLADGEDGGNGVYAYNASAIFPANTFNSANYYADVVFESNDVTAPSVVSVTPPNGSTIVALNVHPTATFDEELNPASVTRSTVVMTAPGNIFVQGSCSLTGGTLITFTPNADLTVNTTYTVTLKGGTTEPVIKDLIGNPLAANYSWSFTTGAMSAPVVTTKPVSQTVCANSTVSLTSAATGIPTPTVQWQVSTDNGGSWSNIPGATSSTYIFTATTDDNNNQYHAVWTNSQGYDVSAPAILTVTQAINGSIGAVNSSICSSDPMELQLVSATGPSPYTLVINSVPYTGIVEGQVFRALLDKETIWPASTVPQIPVQPDNNSLEVGVKFQANKNGQVKGIRFYKGSAANGGTHIGSLWSQSGDLLASATFSNETASGWQEVLFSTPVDVTANTTYVASYFLPLGNYSKDGSYFTSAHSNGNSLTALQNTVAEPNAVYTYTASSAFPTNNAGDPNYWVDVVFAAYPPATTTTFNLTSITADNGCSLTGNPISTATITVGNSVSAGTVSGSTGLCVGATTNYSSNGTAGGTWSSTNTSVATVDLVTGIVTGIDAGTADITYTVTGCSGDISASQTITVQVNVNAGIVSGTSSLCIGATATFSSNGNAGGTWSSSNPAVATVNAAGLVTALTAGTTNIIYTINSGCGSPVSSPKALTVNPSVNAGTVAGMSPLCIGASAIYNSNGNAGGTWSSSNPAIATVNATSGLVTALATGTTNIIYTVNAGCNSPVSSSRSLTVSPNATAGTVAGVSPLCIGATATYSSNGNAGGTWSSSNPVVATVNTSGIVTALTAGSTNITYTVNTGCNSPVAASKLLTVSPNASAGTVAGVSPLCIGANAAYSSNGNTGGTWSSSNPAVASVNSSGIVTALSAGTTNITYTVNTGCNSPVSSSKSLTVSPNANAGTLFAGVSTLCIGTSTTFSSNGDAGGTWSSSNPAVATINAAGLVTALTAGTTNITYTVNAGCNSPVSAFSVLTVASSANAGTVSGTSPLCIGGTANYTSNGNAGGTWSSSNPAVASVNNSGVVTALTAGTTNITYTVTTNCSGAVSSFKTLTVNPSANAGTVSGTSPLCINATATYSSNGNTGGTWSSSNPSVATVNAAGMVTALTAGTTNITYTVSTGCNSPVSSFKTLTVSANVSAGLVSGTSPLCINATATYSSNGNAGGTWSSSNPAIATVNATTGLVTALTAGTTNITYTIGSGCGAPASSFKTLTVGANMNAGTVTGTSPLCINATSTYSTNGNAGGTWSSSDPVVATVSAAGLVTALSAGTTNITYTVSSGCGGPVSSFKVLSVGSNVSAGVVSGTSPLCINATATYSSNGNIGGTWSSSNIAVATVNATTGLVSTLTAGTTNITYTISSGCGGPVSSFKTLTVGANMNAGTVSGTSPLCINATSTYSSNGNTGGIWSSSNPAVATVSAAGLVTAMSAGTTNITYTISSGCGGAVSSFKVLTVSSNVSAGTVTGTSPLCITNTATYTSNGNAGGTWSSSNPVIATVNAAGLVTALSAGTTNITYTISAGCGGPVSSFKTLTVGANMNAGVVSGASPLCINATATYSSNGSAGGTWSSSNPAIATVNAAGLVTALSAGTTSITYTLSAGCGGPLSASKTLTVNLNANSGTVSGTSPMCINTTATYSSNGNTGGTWSSSNTAVATVNATGLVTTLSAGTTNITYTISTGCVAPVSSFKTLTVGSTLNPGAVNGTSPLCIGVTTTYSATGSSGGTWSSSNTAVATVNPTTGAVTALATGTTNIKYTVTSSCGGSVSSFKTLTVSPNANAGIVSGTTPYCSLQTTQFTSDGDPGGTWSSSNPWIAFVWPNGYVTALFFGTANVIYTVNSGCNAPVSSYKTISVSLFAYAGIVSGNSPVCVGTTTNYTSNGSSGGTWSSSNTAVATVNAATGAITAVGAGNAVITYTVRSCTGNASATKTITVNPLTTANAGTVSGTTPICINTTTTYSSNGNGGGVWSSSNPSIASVNASTGLVKGLAAGTTSIKYTVTPVCGNPVSSMKTLAVNNCNTFVNNTNTPQGKTTGNVEELTKTVKPESRLISMEAYPNPSNSEFTLMLKGYSNDKVSIVVTDIFGNKVYQTEGPGREKYTFGKNFVSGIYLVQVLQGINKQSMKLIKE